ncbi:hypothetical protein Hdeb2414_s0013g00402801 [Helianthus debilis subsp. tardiflorus]
MKTEQLLDHPKQHLTDTYAKAKHRYSLNHLVFTDVIRNLIIAEKRFRSISFCNKGIYPANNSLFSFIGLCMAIGHFFLSCLVTGLSVFKEIDFCPFSGIALIGLSCLVQALAIRPQIRIPSFIKSCPVVSF